MKLSALVPAAVAAGILVVAVARPAGTALAAPTAPAQAGTLAISVPAGADLGSVAATVGLASGPLGTVEVVDARGAGDASWQVAVSASDFTTGGGSPPETVPAADVGYDPGPATATTGDGTFAPAPPQASLDGAAPAFAHLGGSDDNAASWSPTLTVTFGADQVAGPYTGTITHSVA